MGAPAVPYAARSRYTPRRRPPPPEEVPTALNPVPDWQKAKDEFFKIAREKKPQPTFLKFFTTSHTGVSRSLQKLADAFQPGKVKPLPTIRKLKANFDAAADKYIELLEKRINEESKNKSTWSTPQTDGTIAVETTKTAKHKALLMLKTRLETYKTTYDVQIESLASARNGDDKIARLEKGYRVTMKNGFTRFNAAAKAVKASPTVATWNAEFMSADAVRSLTTALGSYRAIEKEITKRLNDDPSSDAKMTDEQKRMNDATKLWFRKLTPWGDGDKAPRKMPEDATEKEILAELKKVSALVKECKEDLGF